MRHVVERSVKVEVSRFQPDGLIAQGGDVGQNSDETAIARGIAANAHPAAIEQPDLASILSEPRQAVQ